MPTPNRWIRRKGTRARVDGAPPISDATYRERRRSFRNVTDAIRRAEHEGQVPPRERLFAQPREINPRERRTQEGQGFWPFPFRRR